MKAGSAKEWVTLLDPRKLQPLFQARKLEGWGWGSK